MGDRIRRNRIDSKDAGPGERAFPPVVTGGTPGYQHDDHEKGPLTARRDRSNDMRHILDVRRVAPLHPKLMGGNRQNPFMPINLDGRVALHTERKHLHDYSHRAKHRGR